MIERINFWGIPDGVHLLYQERPITVTDTIVAFGPSRIVMLDRLTGERRTLAEGAQSSYHLCAGHQPESCRWNGDWIDVRRTSFQPVTDAIEGNYFLDV